MDYANDAITKKVAPHFEHEFREVVTMAKKLSASKISKIIEYKHAGYSQHQTAAKLHINQSTVCHYWKEYDGCAEEDGLEAAADKFGGGDVSGLNSLAAEILQENLSIPEAKAGSKVAQQFQELGVPLEDYKSVIKACLKIDENGFLEVAAELVKLEEKLGCSGLDIIAYLEDVANKFCKTYKELEELYQLIKNAKQELNDIKKQKRTADIDLTQHLKQLGLTLNRLKLVENLSLTLKKAGISDEAIGTYLKRQAILDEAKLDMGLFAAIVSQVKVVTYQDGGQALLLSLKEHGGLAAANAVLVEKQKILEKTVAGLEQQAEFKGKLEAEVAELSVEKAALEPYVMMLPAAKEQFDILQSKITEAVKRAAEMAEQLERRQEEKVELNKCIDGLTEKTKDLVTKANQVVESNKQIAELDEKKKAREDEWQSFEGFVALVREQPLKGLEIFSASLPALLESVKKGEHKASSVRNVIVKTLTGSEFYLPMCYACVKKPAKIEPTKTMNVRVVPMSIFATEDSEHS